MAAANVDTGENGRYTQHQFLKVHLGREPFIAVFTHNSQRKEVARDVNVH